MSLHKLLSLLFVSGFMLFSVASAEADGLKLVGQEGRQLEYEGKLSLTGRFERRQDAASLDWRGDRVCFYPTAADASLLPAADKDASWFCFANHNTATQMLSLAPEPLMGYCGVSGTATVEISNYVAEQDLYDSYSQAQLDKVVKEGPVLPLSCQ